MAPSSKPRMGTQVFVCFRGRDVRFGFLTHLYAALDQTGVFTYKDIEDSRKGGKIFPALLKAIEESHIAIIIFSENFASSSWCLQELAKIMEWKAEKDLVVVPVFFKVEPSDVKLKTEKYRQSIHDHMLNGRDSGTLAQWERALQEAGCLKGWHLNDRCEATLIKSIVEYISEWNMFDVFLSFRGRDDRENFVKRLNEALVQKHQKTFMDSENLVMGQDLPPALKDAIKRSRICLVVFSENYAESWWCLKELVQILKGKNQRKQRMLPIFYQVESREVREQKQSYGRALAEHKITFGKRSVEKWGKALSEAADMGEIHVCDGNEDDWISRIVEDIVKITVEIRKSRDEEIRKSWDEGSQCQFGQTE